MLATDEKSAQTISSFLKSELANGKAVKRLSLKGQNISDELNDLRAMSHIENTSDLVKGIILKINDDILVKQLAMPTRELKHTFAAAAWHQLAKVIR